MLDHMLRIAERSPQRRSGPDRLIRTRLAFLDFAPNVHGAEVGQRDLHAVLPGTLCDEPFQAFIFRSRDNSERLRWRPARPETEAEDATQQAEEQSHQSSFSATDRRALAQTTINPRSPV